MTKQHFPRLPQALLKMASDRDSARELMKNSLRHAFGLALEACEDPIEALHMVSAAFAEIYDPIDNGLADAKSERMARRGRIMRIMPARSERQRTNLIEITRAS